MVDVQVSDIYLSRDSGDPTIVSNDAYTLGTTFSTITETGPYT